MENEDRLLKENGVIKRESKRDSNNEAYAKEACMKDLACEVINVEWTLFQGILGKIQSTCQSIEESGRNGSEGCR